MMKCPKCGGAFPTTKTWVRRRVTLVCSRCGLRWRTPWKARVLVTLSVIAAYILLQLLVYWLWLLVLKLKLIDATDPFWLDWMPRLLIGSYLAVNAFLMASIWFIPKRWTGLVCDDLCKKCGYDIRGIDSDVCPECGTEIGGRA